MDGKILSFYNAFYKFAKEDIEANPESITTFFKTVLRIDYDQFVNCWEYVLTKNDRLLSREFFDKLLSNDTLSLAYEKNGAKTAKAVVGNPVIARAVYETSCYACTEVSLDILIGLLMTQKIADAETILKLVQKNTAAKKSFGQFMVVIVEKLFFEMLKKQGNVSRKVDMPKKLATLLSEYIAKIRGPEKALLQQRIRELL